MRKNVMSDVGFEPTPTYVDQNTLEPVVTGKIQ